jgi:hypothetical protein
LRPAWRTDVMWSVLGSRMHMHRIAWESLLLYCIRTLLHKGLCTYCSKLRRKVEISVSCRFYVGFRIKQYRYPPKIADECESSIAKGAISLLRIAKTSYDVRLCMNERGKKQLTHTKRPAHTHNTTNYTSHLVLYSSLSLS